MRPVRPWVLAATALLLFLVWSNSFIAIGYLVGADGNTPAFDWVGLTVARFVPAAAISALWCFGWRRAETITLLRLHWRRLLVCGALIVPGYNLALYYAQQQGVPAPIASLTTALVPLFVLVLAALFLGERPTRRRLAGFFVAAGGMALIASADKSDADAYPLLIALTALAPLCWSVYSVVSKPMMDRASPLVWTYMATFMGTLLVLPLLPGKSWQQWAALDLRGWGALLYLSIPCTVLGFALWTWLLRHLPASSVGFTVFMNPPLTTASKYLLATLFPATFLFAIQTREWVGGLLTLAGLAIAIRRARAG